MTAQARALPEVRQCQDDTDPTLFGAIAVKTTNPDGWGVMSVANGGHHSTDADVEGWAVLSPGG